MAWIFQRIKCMKGQKTIMHSLLKSNLMQLLKRIPPQLIAYYLNVYNFKCKLSQKISEQNFAGVVGIIACLKTNQGRTHF